MTIKERIIKLEKDPKWFGLERIRVGYSGSGDSFDDFWNVELTPEQNNEMEVTDVEDLLWYAIEHSEANFNNEGSEGYVIIDVKNKTLSIDNYHIIQDRQASGEITFKKTEKLTNAS